MRIYWAIFLLFAVKQLSLAQHMQHAPARDSILQKDSSHMSHSFSRNLPMNRNGSGTGWLPDATAMYGHGAHYKQWMLMFMANVFVRYNKQDLTNKGSRGAGKFDAPNWFMLMGQRNISRRGLFHFNMMFSLDAFTIGGQGYPLLFQSGETYKGKRLVDRQHPHDLFSELSLAYTFSISKKTDLFAFLAYPGEPALGPVAFMHRNSALNNPDAPLGHHWQDATHTSFGVATLGFRHGILKIDVSAFTGREPDENRYNFDRARFDSYSFRLSCNPSKELALQISRAFIKSPEVLTPSENTDRSTASLIHFLPFGVENKYLSSTLAWGLNSSDHEEHSFLAETSLQLDRTAIYARYEMIQKSAEELDLAQFSNGHTTLFDIQAITIGASQVFFRKYGNNLTFGIQASFFNADERLDKLYGSNPFSAEIYLRFYPHLMHMHSKDH